MQTCVHNIRSKKIRYIADSDDEETERLEIDICEKDDNFSILSSDIDDEYYSELELDSTVASRADDVNRASEDEYILEFDFISDQRGG